MAGQSALLDFIGKAETARDGIAAYRTIIGHREDQLPKQLTEYSVDGLIAAQLTWGKRWKSSAAGKYQIIRKTMVGLKATMKLTGKEKFTPELQDRMAIELLRQRGFEKAASGQMSVDAFALAIAKEWASMPVLKAMQGQKRKVTRGMSYYAGDGLNKSLVSAEDFERVLATAFGKKAAPVSDDGKPEPFPQKGARNNEVVAQVQRRLKELGYSEIGNIDGDFGDMTEKAILIFRLDAGLPLNGMIDSSLLVALAKAKPRELAKAREEAAPSDVREKIPEAKANWWSKIGAAIGAGFTGIVAAVNWIIASFGDARAAIEPITDLVGQVPLWGWAALLTAGFLSVWFMSRKAGKAIDVAYQEGGRR